MESGNIRISRPEEYETWSDEKKAAYEPGSSMAGDQLSCQVKDELIKRDWTDRNAPDNFPWNLICAVTEEDDDEEEDERIRFGSVSVYGLSHALDGLNGQERSAVMLKYYYLQSDQSIAEDLQVPEADVPELLHDAVCELRNQWTDIGCCSIKNHNHVLEIQERREKKTRTVLDNICAECVKPLKEGKLSPEFVRSLSIDILKLSVRSRICLERSEIFTIGDLLDLGSSENLGKVRNLGKRSSEEIRNKMTEMNLYFDDPGENTDKNK